jgi:hypothetical protein
VHGQHIATHATDFKSGEFVGCPTENEQRQPESDEEKINGDGQSSGPDGGGDRTFTGLGIGQKHSPPCQVTCVEVKNNTNDRDTIGNMRAIPFPTRAGKCVGRAPPETFPTPLVHRRCRARRWSNNNIIQPKQFGKRKFNLVYTTESIHWWKPTLRSRASGVEEENQNRQTHRFRTEPASQASGSTREAQTPGQSDFFSLRVGVAKIVGDKILLSRYASYPVIDSGDRAEWKSFCVGSASNFWCGHVLGEHRTGTRIVVSTW